MNNTNKYSVHYYDCYGENFHAVETEKMGRKIVKGNRKLENSLVNAPKIFQQSSGHTEGFKYYQLMIELKHF